jgi:hypothetical protein
LKKRRAKYLRLIFAFLKPFLKRVFAENFSDDHGRVRTYAIQTTERFGWIAAVLPSKTDRKMQVIKRDGSKEDVHLDKITERIRRLTEGLDQRYIDPVRVIERAQASSHE